MAFNKAHRFRQTDFHFSQLCHALSHPARIAIIRKLNENERCNVSALRADMPLCAASVSQHLKILRDMHIVCCEEYYPTVFYWLNMNMPKTQRALVDLILRVAIYFPQPEQSEITSIARWHGPIRPE